LSQQTIIIRSATEADIPAIVDLIVAQQMRQYSRDPHLPQGQTRVQRAAALAERSQQDALVALNREGRVCSYAHPGVWDLKLGSLLRAFLTARNGIVSTLTFPDPAAEDAETVVRAMVSALDQYWQQAGTTGDLLRWPSIDGWLQAPLAEQGFQLDSICALRPHTPFFAQRPAPGPLQRVRMARPEDEEILVTLFGEELLFHERYTPFVRSSPGVLAAFRRKLKEMWEGDALDVLEAGAPVVLVVEQEQTVVAMAENTLLSVTPGDAPGYTPAGCYWCLDNVGVAGTGHRSLTCAGRGGCARGARAPSGWLYPLVQPGQPQGGALLASARLPSPLDNVSATPSGSECQSGVTNGLTA
jgi:hypothetical protein